MQLKCTITNIYYNNLLKKISLISSWVWIDVLYLFSQKSMSYLCCIIFSKHWHSFAKKVTIAKGSMIAWRRNAPQSNGRHAAGDGTRGGFPRAETNEAADRMWRTICQCVQTLTSAKKFILWYHIILKKEIEQIITVVHREPMVQVHMELTSNYVSNLPKSDKYSRIPYATCLQWQRNAHFHLPRSS